ncbi:MAG: hypothetical protein JJT87_13745 [Halomonas sp.]|nr:hypothetical protein [Halomonas sp.]MCC5902975.1 hypothetical protein [Halomonas sp.]
MNKTQIANSMAIIALPIALGAWLFGRNDWLGVVVFGSFFSVIFLSVYRFRMAIRRSARVYFKEGSLLYRFFDKEKSVLQTIFSFIIAGALAIGFSIFITILSIFHGIFFILVMIVISPITLKIIGGNLNGFDERNINESARTETSIAGFLIAVAFINTILAIIFSAKDLFMFLGDVVRFGNFIFHAEAMSISSSGGNQYSRILLNTYLIFDSFRLAVINELMSAFGMDLENKIKNFYIFYIFVFILNLAKLLPFSIAFVLFAQGVKTEVEPRVRSYIELMKQRIKNWWKGHKIITDKLRYFSKSSQDTTQDHHKK